MCGWYGLWGFGLLLLVFKFFGLGVWGLLGRSWDSCVLCLWRCGGFLICRVWIWVIRRVVRYGIVSCFWLFGMGKGCGVRVWVVEGYGGWGGWICVDGEVFEV